MSKALLFVLAAVSSYLITGLNASIELSKAIYHEDIRKKGSGNPGFNNFRRNFGWKSASLVFALDFLKCVLPCAVFGWLFGKFFGERQLGVVVSGVFAMLGHAYPLWYRFKGGKSVLVGIAFVFLTDWRAGVVAVIVFLIVLLPTRYLSLASMCGAIAASAALSAFGVSPPYVLLFCWLASFFVVARHHENIRRLLSGTETRFRFHHDREVPKNPKT